MNEVKNYPPYLDYPRPYNPQTNADRIRAMNDEELADFLAYTWSTSARAWQKDTIETLHWLHQPAEEGRR